MGKKGHSEELDELAHFFDIQHKHDPPSNNETPSSNKPFKPSRSNGNGSSGIQQHGIKIKSDDTCPLHGGTHTWNECFTW